MNELAKKIFTFISILLIAISIALISAWATYRFVGVERTVEEKEVLIERIQSLEHLVTADLLTKAVIDSEGNDWLDEGIVNVQERNEALFAVIPGRIQAGVDFGEVKEKEVQYDLANKTLHLALPHATWVGEPEVLFEEGAVYFSKGVVENGLQRTPLVEQKAAENVLHTAEKEGALALAEKRAEQFLQKALGLQDVQVKIVWKEGKKE